MKAAKTAIELLRSSKIDTMSVEELEKFLPTLGMNDECTDQMPAHLSEYFGWGLKFWQYPNQLSRLVQFLSKINVSSYAEIGCRWGGTFIIVSEVLKRSNKELKTYACDLLEMSEILSEYKNYTEFKYLQGNSQEPEFFSQFDSTVDFIFIDGDHSYEGVKSDYINALKLNPKYIMFHDISCPDMGVSVFWNEIRDKYTTHEFTEQYILPTIQHPMLGIGIIELK